MRLHAPSQQAGRQAGREAYSRPEIVRPGEGRTALPPCGSEAGLHFKILILE